MITIESKQSLFNDLPEEGILKRDVDSLNGEPLILPSDQKTEFFSNKQDHPFTTPRNTPGEAMGEALASKAHILNTTIELSTLQLSIISKLVRQKLYSTYKEGAEKFTELNDLRETINQMITLRE